MREYNFFYYNGSDFLSLYKSEVFFSYAHMLHFSGIIFVGTSLLFIICNEGFLRVWWCGCLVMVVCHTTEGSIGGWLTKWLLLRSFLAGRIYVHGRIRVFLKSRIPLISRTEVFPWIKWGSLRKYFVKNSYVFLGKEESRGLSHRNLCSKLSLLGLFDFFYTLMFFDGGS